MLVFSVSLIGVLTLAIDIRVRVTSTCVCGAEKTHKERERESSSAHQLLRASDTHTHTRARTHTHTQTDRERACSGESPRDEHERVCVREIKAPAHFDCHRVCSGEKTVRDTSTTARVRGTEDLSHAGFHQRAAVRNRAKQRATQTCQRE